MPQADTLWTEVESRDGLPAQAGRWPSAMSTVHPLSVITAVVSQCRTDLNGAASGAVAELVEQLARQRLTELHAHPEQLIHGGGHHPPSACSVPATRGAAAENRDSAAIDSADRGLRPTLCGRWVWWSR